ncbi:MAG: hypothetical protein QOF58_8082 [Pseudonocardiales bacterium]|jgi:hypothetical protein|nr:hypothetical protein [Pseudonocardiales bacterium]
MRKLRTTIHALIGTVVVIGVTVVTPAAQAITIPVACSENALVDAVNLANSTTATDTLVLASGCTYGLTSPHGGLATITQTAVSGNLALLTAGGVYRNGGTMTTTNSPISADTPNNCVGSTPAVPNCTGQSDPERTCGLPRGTAWPPSTTIHKGLIVA